MVGSPARRSNPVNLRSKLPLQKPERSTQVFDFEEVFSGCLELVEQFDQPLGRDPSDIADCIRALIAKNFYACVKRTVQKTTYHGLERMLNSNSCHQNDDGKWNTSKLFRGYHRGDHKPGAKKISQIEKLTNSKFKHEVNQVLWEVLDVSAPLGNQLHTVFRRLPSGITQLASRCSHDINQLRRGAKVRDGAIYASCQQLLYQAGLPALAALTLLLRKANQSDQQDVAAMIAYFVFRMLVVLGEELHKRGIAHLLYAFYLENIFPLYTEQVLYETAYGMGQAARLVNLLAFTTCGKREKSSLTFETRVFRMSKLLSGRYGYVFIRAFSPSFGPSQSTATSEALARYSHQIDVSQTAWLEVLKFISAASIPAVFNPEFIDPDLDFGIFRTKPL